MNKQPMDITKAKFKTINIGGLGINLEDCQKDKALEVFSLFTNKNASSFFIYRGMDIPYLKARFLKPRDSFVDYSVIDKLFFFGDKSKYYLLKREEKNKQNYLINIQDCSLETGRKIFDKYNKLSSSNSENIIEYLNSVSYFEYFKNKQNKELFAISIRESGQLIRDYYLSVLHTVGNFSLPNKSFHISTSLEFDVAKKFSGKDNNGFVIFYMHRPKDETYTNDERTKLLEQSNLPIVHEKSIYPDQFEIPIRAGIYPQDIAFIYGCKNRTIWVNPHIYSKFNIDIDLTKESLFIPQNNFATELKKETNFTGYNYTLEHEEYLEGNL